MFGVSRQVMMGACLSAALCAAQAQGLQEQARAGAVADGVSSLVGLAAGVPIHPLLPALGAGFKVLTLRHAESLPEAERPRAYALAAASWQASAAGNACAAVSVLSGGSFLPACVVVGVAWGWRTWNASEHERRDAERCAALRASARKHKVRCVVTRQRVERPLVAARHHAALSPPPPPKFIAAQDLVAP
jgi:hypothetical protein